MTLSALLESPPENAARIVLRQERKWAFRWMFLIELAIVLAFFLCLIPVAILIALTLGGDVLEDFSLESFARRAWRYWQEVHVELIGPEGTVVGRAMTRPRDNAEADAVVRSVLVAADATGLTVVHTFGGGLSAHLGTWYGGQPLLTAPAPRDPARARRALERAGVELDETESSLSLAFNDKVRPKWQAALLLAVFWPFLLWTARGRTHLSDLMLDLSGKPPISTVIEVRADGLYVSERRDDVVRSSFDVDGADLLAVAYQPVVGQDRELSLKAARPRIWSRRGVHDLHLPSADLGEAVADFLTEMVLELRDRAPELGLGGREPRRARCPYCATVYKIVIDDRCPSCGAPPTILIGSGLAGP